MQENIELTPAAKVARLQLLFSDRQISELTAQDFEAKLEQVTLAIQTVQEISTNITESDPRIKELVIDAKLLRESEAKLQAWEEQKHAADLERLEKLNPQDQFEALIKILSKVTNDDKLQAIWDEISELVSHHSQQHREQKINCDTPGSETNALFHALVQAANSIPELRLDVNYNYMHPDAIQTQPSRSSRFPTVTLRHEDLLDIVIQFQIYHPAGVQPRLSLTEYDPQKDQITAVSILVKTATQKQIETDSNL